MKKILLLLMAMTVFCAPAFADADEDLQEVINKVMPFAEELLLDYGEFFPFGGAMKLNGEVVTVSGIDGAEEQPLSADVIGMVKHGLRIGAENNDYRATAVVYNVSVVPPGKQDQTDAVAIDVEHKLGYAITIVYPYLLDNGEVKFGDMFAQGGKQEIFRDLQSADTKDP